MRKLLDNGRAPPAFATLLVAREYVAPCELSAHPLGDSTGWVTWCRPPSALTTSLSTLTNAVNRDSTPYRSDVATISSAFARPVTYRSSRSRTRARAHTAPTAVLSVGTAVTVVSQ